MLRNRKRRPLDRSVATLRDARLVIVATEGSVTEEIYFAKIRNTRLQVKVIPSEGGRSSPRHVLDNLNAYIAEYQIGDGDSLWLAIDRDRWPEANLAAVAAECRKKDVSLALSNPCFELWLALHFDGPLPAPTTALSLGGVLKTRLGSYSKSSFNAEIFMNNINKAAEAARALDRDPSARWPNELCTRVYLIIEDVGLDG